MTAAWIADNPKKVKWVDEPLWVVPYFNSASLPVAACVAACTRQAVHYQPPPPSSVQSSRMCGTTPAA